MADETVIDIPPPEDWVGTVAELTLPAYEPRCLRPGCDLGEHGKAWIGTRTLVQADAQAEMDWHWQRHRDAEARYERVSQFAGDMETAWNNYGQYPPRAEAPRLFLALAERLDEMGYRLPPTFQREVDSVMGPGVAQVLPPGDLAAPGAAVHPGVPHVPQPGETDWRLL